MKREDRVELHSVAYLRSLGKTQEVVGEEMGISQAKVSRLLKQAEELAILHKVPTYVFKRDDDIAMSDIERRIHSVRIELDLAVHRLAGSFPTPNVMIYDSGNEVETTNDVEQQEIYEKRLLQFGREVAKGFAELLPRMKKVGITWGQAIANLSMGLKKLYPAPPYRANPITFVPLCGVLLADPNLKLTSSIVTSDIHSTMNGTSSECLSLGAVPDRFPKKFNPKARSQLCELSPGFTKVFGNKPDSLVHQLDCMITSVGVADPKSKDPWLQSLLQLEEVTTEELSSLTVGNIGGVFVSKQGITKTEQRRIDQINNGMSGIRYEHFEACAKRSQKKQSCGVTALAAINPAKAPIVAECIRRGIVNNVLIDQVIAFELVRLASDS